jgi:hypothetical protein
VKKSYNFLQDPGHGWVAVPLKDLAELGLSRQDFSAYSYESKAGTVAYLEEDCDAPKFIAHFEKRFDHKPALVEKHTNNRSHVRSMPYLNQDVIRGYPVKVVQ